MERPKEISRTHYPVDSRVSNEATQEGNIQSPSANQVKNIFPSFQIFFVHLGKRWSLELQKSCMPFRNEHHCPHDQVICHKSAL